VKTQTDAAASDVLRGADVIVAYTDEEQRHDEVRRAALDAARVSGARLIFYPLDLYSALSNPLPNEWSAEGDRATFADPLSVADLELLGQEWLAAQVLDATRAGIDAGASLPESRGIEAMVGYARRHGAGAVLLPQTAVSDADLGDSLLGRDADAAAEADQQADEVAVLLVGPGGEISHVRHGVAS